MPRRTLARGWRGCWKNIDVDDRTHFGLFFAVVVLHVHLSATFAGAWRAILATDFPWLGSP